MRLYVVSWIDTAPEDDGYAVVAAYNPEQAKHLASPHLSGDPEKFYITPLPAITESHVAKPRVLWDYTGIVPKERDR